jgi:small subunit ribosomal protein S6
MGTYEIVAVLRPDLDEEGLGAALDRIGQRIAEHGGSISSQERWGKRKLAYPIKKQRDGFYTLFVFTLDPGRIMPLRQILGLNEELLRFTFASHRAKPVPVATPAASGQAAASAPPAAPTVRAPDRTAPATEPPHV